MSQPPKHFIVEAAALPEIFVKVAEAKRLLETGEASRSVRRAPWARVCPSRREAGMSSSDRGERIGARNRASTRMKT